MNRSSEQLSNYHDNTKCEHLSVQNIRPYLFSGKVCVRECAGAWGAHPHRPNRYEHLQAWADKGYPGWLKAQYSLNWHDFLPGNSCWSFQCWSLCWHVPSFGRSCHWGGRSLFLPQVHIFNILPDAWVSFEPEMSMAKEKSQTSIEKSIWWQFLELVRFNAAQPTTPLQKMN